MKLEIYANGTSTIKDDLNLSEMKLVLAGALAFSSVLEGVGDVGIIISNSQGGTIFDGDLERFELLSELF